MQLLRRVIIDKTGMRQYPLPGKSRLKKKADFAEVQGNGRRIPSAHFLLIISRQTTKTSRLGLVVTKKLDKRAVVRNKIKRRLRDIVRHLLPEFVAQRDFVIIARQGVTELSFDEFKLEITALLRKAKLLS